MHLFVSRDAGEPLVPAPLFRGIAPFDGAPHPRRFKFPDAGPRNGGTVMPENERA